MKENNLSAEEAIRQAATSYCKDRYKDGFDDPFYTPDVWTSMSAFKAGAKWQAEFSSQQNKAISEELERNKESVSRWESDYSELQNRNIFLNDRVNKQNSEIQSLNAQLEEWKKFTIWLSYNGWKSGNGIWYEKQYGFIKQDEIKNVDQLFELFKSETTLNGNK